MILIYQYKRGGEAVRSDAVSDTIPPPRLQEELLPGLVVAHLYLYLLRLGDLLLGQGDRQCAVLIVSLHSIRIHRIRQRENALEVAVGTLDAMPAAFVLLLFELPFTLDGERAVFHADVDVLELHVG